MKNKSFHPAMYWIHLYGYVVLAAALYGILAAHIPVMLGHQWSTCLIGDTFSLPCSLTMHLYDGSLTMMSIIFAWYSIKKAKVSAIRQYQSYLMVIIAMQLAFFTFECVILFWNFNNDVVAWQNFLIASIAVILLGGIIMGVFINSKVISLTED